MARRLVDAGARVEAGQVAGRARCRRPEPAGRRLPRRSWPRPQADLALAESELRPLRRTWSTKQLVSQSLYDSTEGGLRRRRRRARSRRGAGRGVRQPGRLCRAARAARRRDRQRVRRSRPGGGRRADRSSRWRSTASAKSPSALPEAAHPRVRGRPAEWLVELWSDAGPALARHASAKSPRPPMRMTRTYAARVALRRRCRAASSWARARASTSQRRGAAGAAACRCRPCSAATKGQAAVWVVDPATGKVRRAPVQLGPLRRRQRAGAVPVCRPDDWVVAAGGHLLREGEPVAPVDRDNRPVLAGPPRAAAAGRPSHEPLQSFRMGAAQPRPGAVTR